MAGGRTAVGGKGRVEGVRGDCDVEEEAWAGSRHSSSREDDDDGDEGVVGAEAHGGDGGGGAHYPWCNFGRLPH